MVLCGEGSNGKLVSYEGEGAEAVVFGAGGDEGGEGGDGHDEAINSIDCVINRNGKLVIATGGNDCLVCCWDYQSRACTHKVSAIRRSIKMKLRPLTDDDRNNLSPPA